MNKIMKILGLVAVLVVFGSIFGGVVLAVPSLDDDPVYTNNSANKAVSLAEEVVGAEAPYLLGGKGWDYGELKFVDSATIKSGYYYWNAAKGKVDWGQGLDCSGLVFWAYNKAAGATKYKDSSNPVYAEGAHGQWNDTKRFEQISTTIPTADDLKTGYLLFLDTPDKGIGYIDHVGMYVGNGYVIHSRGSKGVEKETLNDWLNISLSGGKRYKDYFVGYGRVTIGANPPIASFTYSPEKTVANEEVTFDAYASYDPDGGDITNYRWVFYGPPLKWEEILPKTTRSSASAPGPLRNSESLYASNRPIPIRPIGSTIVEGPDKQIIKCSFRSTGLYRISLAVTDDEGDKSLTRKEILILPELLVHNINTGEDFSKIQEAINDADTKDGHIIIVDPGAYNGNVDVTKSLTIRSTSGNPEDTIVQAKNSNDHVFEVTANYVIINGFTVEGATGGSKAGIYHHNGDHCTISGNNIVSNQEGIRLGDYSYHDIITNNNINSNQYGISLRYSSYNTVTNNSISVNHRGMNIFRSSYNNITENTFEANTEYGLHMLCHWSWSAGMVLCSYHNRVYHNNFIDNYHKPQMYACGDNFLDDGYPSGGNYWSDYAGEDLYRGPNQDQLGSDGIGDTPYTSYDFYGGYLYEGYCPNPCQDGYPFMNHWTPSGPDTTPPTVVSASPEDGAVGIAVDTVVTATFSEAMDSSTVTTDSFTLAGSAVSGTVTYDPATYTATFTPDADLEYNHEYTATLSTDITDKAGNPLAEVYRWGFTTHSGPAPPPPDYFSEEWIEKVINWASAQEEGKDYWYEHCMRFVSDAFKVCENRPGSANELKDSLESAGEFYSKENGWEPPRGSVVFFSANHPYEDEGHIGISLGGERVIHSLGTVGIETIDEIEENSFIKSYLGWAYPPEGWFSPKISNTFEVGDSVFKKEVWNLRDIPSLYGKKLTTESGNAEIIEDAGTDTDINGICNAGYYWWHIRFGDYDGWCAEKGFLYIELRKDGVKIDEIDVGEFFDIYVGDSTDDTGIREVRFSSDESQDGIPKGEWTEWYDWDTSSGDWDAEAKIKRWSFATGGKKEVWAEVKDNGGNIAQCHANIFVHPAENQRPGPPTDLIQLLPDGTKISVGGAVDEHTVVFKGVVTDPDGDGVKLQIELRRLDEYGGEFDETQEGLKESDFVASSSEAEVSFHGLIPGDYHWRARTIDEYGEVSEWADFGNNPLSDPDFIVVPELDENPRIVCIEPESGAPGIEATIKGRNLKGFLSGSVDFGSISISIGLVESLSDNEIVVKVPPTPPTQQLPPEKRKVDVIVIADGRKSNPVKFTYSEPFIDRIDPSSGRPGEGVTISGKDFGHKDLHLGFWVNFGKSHSPKTSPWTDTEIMAKAPSDYGLGIKDKMMMINLIKYAALGWAAPFEEIIKEIIKDTLIDLLAHGVKIPAGEGKIDVDVSVRTPVWTSNVEVFTYDVDEIKLSDLLSPSELRIYDLQGRVTGLVNGQVKEGIPYSYCANNTILVVYPSASYRYQVVGTKEGVYKLRVISAKQGEATTFTATDIPTAPGAIHQYTIDWEALSRGEKGVTVQIDNDGDGVFEQTIITGNTFQPPIASFTYSPENPVVNETITFDASNSYGNITKYEWNFGDRNITDTTEPIITHSYASAGDYTVNLTATDDDGATNSTIKEITVSPSLTPPPPKPNQPPILSNGYVTPSSGDTSTIFNYYVTYIDHDGDAPTEHFVVIAAPPREGGISYHTMTKISGDYTSGATFKYSTTLPALPAKYNYQYNFIFDDGHNHTAVYPDTGMLQGPIVAPSNQPPILSDFSADGHVYNTYQTFDFYITYKDPDGDAPTTKCIYIDGSPHTMTKISGDYTSGARFENSATLSGDIEHNFYFYFEDGHGHSVRWPASETIVIPIPPPAPKPSPAPTPITTPSPTPIPTPQPDLIVKDIWIEPAEFEPGNTVKLWQRTKNIGDEDAVGTFRMKRYFDGAYISSYNRNGLTAGQGFTTYKTYTWPSDCDSHTITVVVDPEDAIAESIEDNNELSKSFSAVPPPTPTLPPSPSPSPKPTPSPSPSPKPNQPPILSDFSADGDIQKSSQTWNFYITYKDPDGDAPTTKCVYVDGSPHTMTKISGDYVSGAKFKYSTTLSVDVEHNYYFYFDDGHGHTVRWPASETIVIPIPPPPPKP